MSSNGQVAPGAALDAIEMSSARKWLTTVSVMVVAFMQVLDTSVTNVVLPHLQGSLSAGLEEVSWVLTSYLAANAVVIPATGWLAGYFGRKRFFLICATIFTISSFLSGIAPNLTFLVLFSVIPPFLVFMRRVRVDPSTLKKGTEKSTAECVEPLPAAAE